MDKILDLISSISADKEEAKREKAATIILNTRITERSDPYPTSRRKPRLFINPSINMDADDYSEMVTIERPYARGYYYFTPSKICNYNSEVKSRPVRLTEPPITKELADEEIEAFKSTPLKTDFKCHSQSCERGVAMTSQHTSKLSKYLEQLGSALLAEHHKRILPTEITHKRTYAFENAENVLPLPPS